MNRASDHPKLDFPVVVERGPTGLKGRASIHFMPSTAKGKKYRSYTVIYYQDGKRQRTRFPTYPKAFAKAEEVATKLSSTDIKVLSLSEQDRENYVAAEEAIQGCGIPLIQAAREYAEARKVLGEISIIEAALFFNKHGRSIKQKGTTSEVLAKMLKGLEADKRSSYHIRDIRRRIGKFAAAFPGDISDITTNQVSDWLRKLEIGSRTRDNYRDGLQNLFNFAKSEGFLPREQPTAIEDIKRIRQATPDNEVFTVKEMTTLLHKAPAHLVPSLALKAFSGLRSEEMLHIRWEDIRFDQDSIFLSGKVVKTKQRRVIPLMPNLKAWLLKHRQESGRIAARCNRLQSLSNAWCRHAVRVGVTYKRNALRNSYISYRLACTADAPRVALEAGNSPRVVLRDYLGLVTPQDGEQWFQIVPPGTTLPKAPGPKEPARVGKPKGRR